MIDIGTRIEPMPTTSDGEACWDVAISRIRDHKYGGGYVTSLARFAVGRDEFGTAKYKTRLRPNDGRSSLVDALQEGLDKLVYLVKAEMEDIDVAGLIDDEIRALIRLAGVLDKAGLLWDETKKQPHIADTCGEGDPSNWKTWPSDQREQIEHMFDPGTVPGFVVTESLKNRGLRVGMTFQEVNDNQWTQCEGDHHMSDYVTPICTEGNPCSACKFLDGALCECGHPFTVHHPAMASFASDCHACPRDVECPDFSLASWTNETVDDVAAEVAAHVNANVDGWTAEHAPQPSVVFLGASHAIKEVPGVPSQSSDVILLPVSDPSEGVRTQSEERNRDLATEAERGKRPRVNRATWHETDEGKDAILRVTGALTSEPVKSWYAREVANEISVGASDVSLALEHLISTGAITKHGRAKGTRYAVAGFTDWPAPLPRGKKQDDQFAEEEPPIIIGAHGAT